MKAIKTLVITLFVIFALGAQAQKVVKINQEKFYEMFNDENGDIVNTGTLAIVDFNADWCGPCKRLAPILDELAEDYEGYIRFYSINTDDNQKLTKELGIRGIPYLLFIYPGTNHTCNNVGFIEKDDLISLIAIALNGADIEAEPDEPEVEGTTLATPTGDIEADSNTLIDLMVKCIIEKAVSENDVEATFEAFEAYYKELDKGEELATTLTLALLGNEELMKAMKDETETDEPETDEPEVEGTVLATPTGDMEADVNTVIGLMVKSIVEESVDENDLEATMKSFESYYKGLDKGDEWSMSLGLALLGNDELMNALNDALGE